MRVVPVRSAGSCGPWPAVAVRRSVRVGLIGVLAVALMAGSSPVWAQEASPVATTEAAPQASAPGAPGGVFVPAVGGPVERVPGPDGTELLLAADQGSAQIAAAAERRPVEIVGRRSEVSSTWAMPNGTLSSRLAAGPLWVRRGGDGTLNRDWALIDLTLERRADGTIGPRAHPSACQVPGLMETIKPRRIKDGSTAEVSRGASGASDQVDVGRA